MFMYTMFILTFLKLNSKTNKLFHTIFIKRFFSDKLKSQYPSGTFFRKTHKLPSVIVDTFFDILKIAPVPARS